MSTILDQLAEHARERVKSDREKLPLPELRKRCGERPGREPFLFEQALRKPGLSFICEVKKASPSKGVISGDFPYLAIARDYEEAGADCISCLTEPKWFLGSDEIFRAVRGAVSLPMLRKDFTVDEYQLYQAREMGADAALLICAVLSPGQLRDYLALCRELGLSALTEAHDEEELNAALAAGAALVGVNNRNLKDFSVDTGNSSRLRALAPPGVLFVSESGIRTPDDVERLRRAGADAVLVGEALMRAPDRQAALRKLRGAP